MKKKETLFRENSVKPFLQHLANSHWFSIQQITLRGHPDIVGCVNGWFVGIEIKDVGEVPRALQKYHLDKIEKAGGIAISTSKENWDQVKELLNDLTTTPREGETWKTAQLS